MLGVYGYLAGKGLGNTVYAEGFRFPVGVGLYKDDASVLNFGIVQAGNRVLYFRFKKPVSFLCYGTGNRVRDCPQSIIIKFFFIFRI